LPFDALVEAWRHQLEASGSLEQLDGDRVGVFWALLFLCAQGSVELDQNGGLFGPLQLRRPREGLAGAEGNRSPGAVPLRGSAEALGSDGGPAREALAA
jgi:segregation and condensation protein A